ncbi:hypothetical protein ACFYY8_37885 [Streptosporangium sp. NPDC001559]|uniref:hypothetical protein n=1 Tax=Streptosporangium sp. NPDC001559 TaxID=3366187 RepID=UPI0036EADAB3
MACRDGSKDAVKPFLKQPPFADRGAIIQGYTDPLLQFPAAHRTRTARYGEPAYEILRRAGEAVYVGGRRT